jgi:hypothetical protein
VIVTNIFHDVFDVQPVDIYWEHVIREGFLFWQVGYFIWDRNKPEVVCDEAINKICGDDSCSLRGALTHVVP